MDSITINELKLLESNQKKIDTSLVYDLMIHSIKGKYVCEESRKKFVISRALPMEKVHNPKFAAPYAANFLDCYAEMLNITKDKCQPKYKKIYECLVSNHSTKGDFNVKCVAAMEDFLDC